MSLRDISVKTRIPISTIHDRMKTYSDKIIQKHTSLIDFESLGYAARVYVILKVAKEDKSGLGEFLLKNQSVNTLHKINNGYDFMFEGIFESMKSAERFIESLEKRFNVKEVKTHYIIEDLKKESFMSNPNLID